MTDQPTGWVDSHCHLPMLTGDAADPAGDAVTRARDAGVVGMICVGTNLETSRGAIADAARFPDVRATVGLHPHDASALEDVWDDLVALATLRHCGRDRGDGLRSPLQPLARATRRSAAFRAHIQLAHRLDRALVIHSRNAWDDTFRVLAEEGVPERTVFHCFTGGPDEASARARLGRVPLVQRHRVVQECRRRARRPRRSLPLDRMLVETDAPFLAPVPHRGRENEPAFVVDVGAALAAAVDRPLSAVAAVTRANAEVVFGHLA